MGQPLITPQGDEEEVVITPPKTPSSRSSVLFALGQLSAQVASLKEIPAQVTAVMLPRITHLEAIAISHDTRLAALERTKYVVWGGGVVILAGAGLIIKLSPAIFR